MRTRGTWSGRRRWMERKMEYEKILVVVVPLVVGALAYLLALYLKKNPDKFSLYELYWPVFVDAIKAAERIIPDDVPNKALAKFDLAMKHILEEIVRREGGFLTKEQIDEVKVGVTKAHQELNKPINE